MTVPLTSGLIGHLSGQKHVATPWGIVFVSHQMGSFAGGWGAGFRYDAYGNHDLIRGASVALGLITAAIHWCIREEPVARLVPRPP